MNYFTGTAARALAVIGVVCAPWLAYQMTSQLDDKLDAERSSSTSDGVPFSDNTSVRRDTADNYYGSDEPVLAAANPVDAQSWTVLPNIKNPRFESTVVQYRDDLYVFNGFGKGIDVEPAVEKFDAGTQTWSVISNTSIAKGNAVTHNGFVVIGNEAWMLGGRIGNHPGAVTANVWKFNFDSKQWSAGPKLPVPVAAGGAALVGNRIHWFGGLDAKASCDVANHYVYDLDRPGQGWSDISGIAPMPVPRNHFATVVFNGLIYAIGGQFTHDGCGAGTPDTNLVHKFNPQTNTWTQVASLPAVQSHIEPSTFVHKGAIYVVGGATSGNKVYRYDPANDDWDTVAELPQALLAPVARVIDDQLIVSTGGAPATIPSLVTYATDMAPLLLDSADSTPVADVDEPVAIENPVVQPELQPEQEQEQETQPEPQKEPEPQQETQPAPQPNSESNTDGSTSVAVNETVTNDGANANQTPGLVVFEAEFFDTNVIAGTHKWVSANLPGDSNNASMVTTPDSGKLLNSAVNSPSLSYFANFDRSGTWYLWVLGWGDTIRGEGKSDSLHAGLNNELSATADKINSFPTGWNWSNSTRDGVRATLNVPSAGIHAVNLWMREDGLAIDKILLTTDPGYRPPGFGNNSSVNASAADNQIQNDAIDSVDNSEVANVTDNNVTSDAVIIDTEDESKVSSDVAESTVDRGSVAENSVSTEQPGNVENNDSDNAAVTIDDDASGETGITDNTSVSTEVESVSTVDVEVQSNTADNSSTRTSGSGSVDKFLLLLLICFVRRKRVNAG